MFEWDPNKAQQNRKKHGISFEEAASAFFDPLAAIKEDRSIDGEQRLHLIGKTETSVLVVVAHVTYDEENQQIIRIISSRKASRIERNDYEMGAGSF